MSTKTKILKAAGTVILAILAMALFVAVIRVALAREANRQETVFADQCRYYGAEMNEFYGREVCPPTPQG